MAKDIHLESAEATLQASNTADTEELTISEIAELVEEATMLRWSSKPTTRSGRCC